VGKRTPQVILTKAYGKEKVATLGIISCFIWLECELQEIEEIERSKWMKYLISHIKNWHFILKVNKKMKKICLKE
jgi:hypothetical protein